MSIDCKNGSAYFHFTVLGALSAPFHLSAFQVVAAARAPAVPLTLRGARSMLRAASASDTTFEARDERAGLRWLQAFRRRGDVIASQMRAGGWV